MESKAKERVKSFIIVILLIIILAFVIYEIRGKTNQNKVSDIYQNLVTNVTKEIETTNEVEETISSNNNAKYPLITQPLNDIDVLFVTDVNYNDDKTITLNGVIYTRYILSGEEMNDVIDKEQISLHDKTYRVEYNAEDDNYWCLEGEEEYPLYVLKKYGDSTSYELCCQAQISTCYKLTDSYRSIIISEDLDIPLEFADVESMSAKEYFKNFKTLEPYDTFTPLSEHTFSFIIENGVCTEIINNLTSI